MTNQSFEVSRQFNHPHIKVLTLPVTFKKAFELLQDHLLKESYLGIIALGEGPNQVVHIEHVAMNMMHARIPDNLGFQPQLTPIDPSTPITLKTTLPLDVIAEALTNMKLPYSHSFHAGTYVCNDLLYRLLAAPISIPRGFIHVPNNPTQQPMSVAVVEAVIQVCFDYWQS